MSSAAEEYVIYQIANAPIRDYPYPHIYVENVFPADFYAALRANWPDPDSFVSIGDTGRVGKGNYAERFVFPVSRPDLDRLPEAQRSFWNEFTGWFLGNRFLIAMVDKFDTYVKQRFGAALHQCRFAPDVLVVRDHTNYKIGPHTDAPHRLLSMLFYCPDDDSRKHLGTSIYTPLDPGFRCRGGSHYSHDLFRKVQTMNYQPNSLFSFFKTSHSFHGVEPIRDENVMRDLLLYDIRVTEAEQAAPAPVMEPGIKMLRKLFSAKRG